MDENQDDNQTKILRNNPQETGHSGEPNEAGSQGAFSFSGLEAQNGALLSLAEASKKTGYHQDYLGFLCRTGKLNGFKIGRNWVIPSKGLEIFQQNNKNGSGQVANETETKIPVKVERPALQKNISAENEAVTLHAGFVTRDFTSLTTHEEILQAMHPASDNTDLNLPNLPHGEALLPNNENPKVELSHLRQEVFSGINEKVKGISESLQNIEAKVKAAEEKALQASSHPKKELELFGIGPDYSLDRRPHLQNKFQSNFAIAETAPVADTPQNIRQPHQRAKSKYWKDKAAFLTAFGQLKVDQLKDSFRVARTGTRRTLALAVAVSVLGFLTTLGWNYLQHGHNQTSPETKVVYIGGKLAGDSSARTNPSNTSNGNGSLAIVEKITKETVVKSLSADTALISQLIDQRLNQYLAEGKFRGEKGDKGEPGVAQTLQGGWTVGYVQPTQPGGQGAGTIGSFTYFSADKLTATNATVDNSLTVNGSANFSGDVNLNGTTTIANLNISNLNLGFTQGSVVFQGSSGLAQDNGNFYWDDTNNRLGIGTASPVATLSVAGSGSSSPFTIASSSGATMLTLSDTGYFGINTSTPSQALTVAGNGLITGDLNVLGSISGASLSFSSSSLTTLNVTGTSTLSQAVVNLLQATTANITTLNVTGTSTLSGALIATGPSSLATTSITQLNVSGNISLATMTQGSVLFAGAGGVLSQNNSNLYWDNANKYFNIGTSTVQSTLAIQAGGSTNPLSILSPSGSSLLSVLQDGKVGIGIANPTERLEVNGVVRVGTADDAGMINLGDTLTGAGNYTNGIFRGGLGTTAGGGYLNLGAWTGIAFNTSGTWLGSQTTRMVIDGASGNVGIGTITPTTTLFVQGKGGTNPFAIASSTGSQLLTVTQSGNVGIGTTSPAQKLDVYNGSLRIHDSSSAANPGHLLTWTAGSSFDIKSEYNLNLFADYNADNSSAYRNITFNTGATERVRIQSDGNVGIGTTSPLAKLDVYGNLNVATGSTPALFVNTATSRVGVGTSTPSSTFVVNGESLFAPVANSSNSFQITNSSGTALFTVDTTSNIVSAGRNILRNNNSVSGSFQIQGTLAAATAGYSIALQPSVTKTVTSGTSGIVSVDGTYAPTSGTGEFNSLSVAPTINQTGGANGITRGLYINPTITSAADWRSLEVATGTSVFLGNVGIGTSTPTTKLYVVGGMTVEGPTGNADLVLKAQDGKFWDISTTQTSGEFHLYDGSNNVVVIQRGISANSLLVNSTGISAVGTLTVQGAGVSSIAGNLGIGTTTPGQKLVVAGDARITGALYDSTNSAGSSGNFLMSTASGYQWTSTSTLFGGSQVTGSGISNYVARWTGTNTLGTGALYDNGTNVGIGTSSPNARLQIPYTVANQDIILGAHNGGGTTALLMGISAASGGYGSIQAIQSSGSSNGNLILNGSGGRVGIGSSAPGSLLTVKGYDSTSANSALNITNSNNLSLLFVRNDGPVGINTTTPNYGLTVATTSYFTGLATFTGGITSPGTGSNSERYGLNATASNTNSIAIGNGANAAGINTIAIGLNASSSGNSTIVIGKDATSSASSALAVGTAATASSNAVAAGATASASGANSIALGSAANAAFANSIAIGQSANAGFASTIVLGSNAVGTAAHQFVAGGPTGSTANWISDVYFGAGVLDSAPVGYTIHGTGGSGTDITGGDLQLAGGQGTGSALGGALVFKTAASSTTGSSLNSLTERMRITPLGNVGIGQSNPSSILTINQTAAGDNGLKLQVAGTTKLQLNPYDAGTATRITFSNNAGQNLIDSSADLVIAPTTDLKIRAGSNEYVTFVGSSQRVGIGTTTPGQKLVVAGDARITGALYDSTNSAGSSGNFLMSTASGYQWTSTSTLFGGSQVTGSGISNYVARWTGTNTLGTGVLFDDGTNVGIGTTSPSKLFTVGNNNQFTVDSGGNVVASGTISVGINKGLYGRRSDGVTVTMQEISAADNFNSLLSSGSSYGVAIKNTLSQHLLTVLNNGNVGIGNSAPSYMLDVYPSTATSTNLFRAATSTGAGLYVTSAGNVGIGTAAPGYKLEVNGTGSFSGNVRLVNASLYDNGNGFWMGGSSLKYTSTGIIGFTNSANASDAASVALSIGGAGKVYVGNGTAGDYTGTLVTGNVGIGTTSPVAKLDIFDGSSSSVRINPQSNYLVTIGSAINAYFGNNQSVAKELLLQNNGGNVGIGNITTTGLLDVNNLFVVKSSGNVGIGLTSPNYKLEVAGTASTTALNVVGNIYNATLTASSLVMSDAGKNLASVSLGSGLSLNGGTLNTTQIGGAWTVGSGLIYNATSTDLVGIGTITPTTTLFVQGKGGTNPFAIASSTGTQLLTVTQSGNVGIGTANPTYNLQVAGTGYITGNVVVGSVSLSVNSNNKMEGIWDGTYWNNDIRSTGNLYFHTNGNSSLSNPAMLLTTTGSVGIGTTTPTARLNVTSSGTVNPFVISSSSGVTLISADYQGNFNLATLTASSLVMSDAGKNLASVSLGSGLSLNGSTLNTTQIGGAWTIGSGLIYNATSTDLVGIGTITPTTTLFVQGKGGTNPFAIASSSGTQLLTVTQSGNVGIGTTSPLQKLHVSGNVQLEYNNNIYSTKASGGSVQLVRFDSNNDMFVGDSSNNFGNLNLNFGSAASNYLKISTSGNATVVVNGSTGNVGIGTTSPGGKLHIVGLSQVAAANNTALRVSSSNDDSKSLFIGYDTTAGIDAGYIQSAVYGGAYKPLLLNPNAGNVGIGTSTPTAKLDVQGGVINVAPATGVTGGLTITSSGGANASVLVTNGTQQAQLQQSFVGSTSNSDFSIYTNGSAKLHVTNTGNVGIGTTSPAALLAVGSNNSPLATNGVSGALFAPTTISTPVQQTVVAISPRITANTGGQQSMLYIKPQLTADLNSLYGIVIDDKSGAGTSYDYAGISIAALSNFTNSVGVLIGTTTIPTGDYGIYSVTSNPNYFAGNVGIGTTSPDAPLTVTQTVGGTNSIFAHVRNIGGNANQGAGVILSGSVGTKYNAILGTGDGRIFFYNNLSSIPTDHFANSSSMVIRADGNIGIATATPGQKLVVAGDARITGALYDSTNSAGSSGNFLMSTASGYQWTSTSTLFGGSQVTGSGTNGLVTRWTGANTIGTGILIDNGTVAGVNATSSSYAFNIQGTGSVHPLQVGTSTNTSMLVVRGDSGNVGIGTSSPVYKLDVQGGDLGVANAGSTTIRITNTNGVQLFMNAGSSSAGIYTNTSHNLNLGTAAATNALQIINSGGVANTLVLNSGNVGIGTATPDHTLSLVASRANSGLISITNTAANGYSTFDFYDNTGALKSGFGYGNGSVGGSVWPGNTVLWSNNNKFIFSSNGANTAHMVIDTTGIVGIGTTSPFAGQLQVNKSLAGGLGGDLWITNSGANTVGSYSRLAFGPDGTADTIPNAGIENVVTATTTYTSDLVFKIYDGSAYNEKVRIMSTGNVGIGTTSPLGKLHVVAAGQSLLDLENTSAGGRRVTVAVGDTGSNTNQLTFNDRSGTGINVALGIATGANSYITSGNVGIGTTSPAARVDVQPSVSSADALVWRHHTGGYIVGTLTNNNAYGTLQLQSGSTVNVSINGGGSSYFNGGNVGIGTTSPDSKLVVQGTARIGSLAGGNTVFSGDSGIDASISVRWQGGERVGITENSGTVWGGNGAGLQGAIRFGSGTEYAYVGSTGINNLIINPVAGNVGIGTTSPVTKLNVYGPADSNYGQLRIESDNNYSGLSMFIRSGVAAAGDRNWQIQTNYSGSGNLDFLRSTTNSGNPTTNVMSINNQGNVGIGTTSPSSFKLQVQGSIGPDRDLTYDLGSSSLRWNNLYMGGNLTLATFTQGSVLFAGAGGTLSQKNAQFFWDNATNRLGLGTSTPTATLEVNGSFKVNNGAISYSTSTNLTTIDNLELGNMTFDSNAGMVSLIDMPVTASSTQGTVHSYTAQLDGNPLLTVYGQSDGSGGIQNPGVGVGTSTPIARFSVQGAAGSNALIDFASSTGTSLFRVTAAGNVGIGTTSPASGLDIATAYPQLTLGALNNAGQIQFRNGSAGTVTGYIGYTSSSSGASPFVISATGAGVELRLNPNNATGFQTFYAGTSERMRIDSAGNVGIGTTTPGFKLDVVGAAGVASSIHTLANSTGGVLIGYGGNDIQGRTSTDQNGNLILNPYAGNVGIGTTTASSKLQVQGDIAAKTTTDTAVIIDSGASATSNLLFRSNGAANWTITRTSGSDLQFAQNESGNAIRMTLQNGGNVGIGTTTPGRTFVVAGDMRATGILYDSTNSAGTSGNFLMSTATGYAWTSTSTLFGGSQVTGSGTNGYVTRWTGANTISTGILLDSGSRAGINATSSSYTFNIQGSSGVSPLNIASSSGTSLVLVDQNGNVGIGVASPAQKLQVNGTALVGNGSDSLALYVSSDNVLGIQTLLDASTNPGSYAYGGDNNVLVLQPSQGRVGIGTTTMAAKLAIQATTGNTPFEIASSTGPTLFRVMPSGNVGVGFANVGAFVNINSAYFKPAAGATTLDVYSSSSEATINLISNASTTGAQMGGLYFTRSTGQSDAHYQIAGIQARQSGVGTLAGGDLFFFTKITGAGTASTSPSMVIMNSGNVGIGTTSPNAKLVVYDSSASEHIRFGYSDAYYWSMGRNISNGNLQIIYNNNSSPVQAITATTNGNVGIGTTSPQDLLEIGSGTTGRILMGATSGVREYYASGSAPRWQISRDLINSGQAGIGFAPVNGGTILNYVGTDASGNLAMYTNGTANQRLTVTTAGNVGVGTTTPLFKMQVAGTANVGDGPFVVSGGANANYFYDSSDTSAYFYTPNFMVRSDSATTTLAGTRANTVFYNKNGTQNSWTKLSLANNETTAVGANPVSIAGIAAQLTAGTAGAWASGDLALWTKSGANENEVLRVTSGQNVGIGTTTPSQRLTISNSGHAGQRIENTSNLIALGLLAGTAGTAIEYSSDFSFLSRTYSDVGNGGGTPQLTIKQSSGNVGIGTTGPISKLSVVSADNAGSTNIAVFAANNQTQGVGIGYADIRQVGTNAALNINANGSGAINIGNSSTGGVMLAVGGGNVGIGTSSPTQKLDITGNAVIRNNAGVNRLLVDTNSGSYARFYGYSATGVQDLVEFPTGIYSSAAGTSLYVQNAANFRGAIANDTGAYLQINGGTSGYTYFNGNVGIGTSSPSIFKLQAAGHVGPDANNTYDLGSSSYKWRNIYASNIVNGVQSSYSISGMSASNTQARQYEIARVSMDYNDWSYTGPIEVELLEKYYGPGIKKRYSVYWGYNNTYGVRLVEASGEISDSSSNNFSVTIGAPVVVSGDVKYVPIYVNVRNYATVDAIIRTNRTVTSTNPPTTLGEIYINTSASPSNIADFTADSGISIAPTYFNVGIGTTSPTSALYISTDSSKPALSFIRTDVANAVWNFAQASSILSLGSSQSLSLYNTGSVAADFGIRGNTSGAAQFMVQGSTGYVGIGTSSPKQQLQIGAYWSGTHNSGSTVLVNSSGGQQDVIPTVNISATSSVNTTAYIKSIGLNIHNDDISTTGTRVPALTFSRRASATYTDVLGAIDAVDTGAGLDGNWRAGGLAFHTANAGTYGITEKMRITSAGNVGIGTTSPFAKLNVMVPATNSITTVDGTNTAGIVVTGSDSRVRLQLGVGSSTVGPYGGWIQSSYDNMGGDNGVEPLLLNPVGGNVGIGTTSPVFKLDVNGDINVAGQDIYINGNRRITDSFSANYSMISPQNNNLIVYNGANNQRFQVYDSSGNKYVDLYSDGTAAQISSGGTTNLALQPSAGNVGIGTTSPTQKLSVAGQGIFYGSTVQYDPSADVPALRVGYYSTGDYGYIQAVHSGSAYKTLAVNPGGGNVGIGTTAPAGLLHVDASSNRIILTTQDVGAAETTDGAYGVIFRSGAYRLGDFATRMVKADESGGIPLYVQTNESGNRTTWVNTARFGSYTANSNKFETFGQTALATAGGNVGIGTTSPNAKLFVKTGTDANLRIDSTGSSNTYIASYTDNGAAFSNLRLYGTNLLLNGDGGGNVAIGTITPTALINNNVGKLLDLTASANQAVFTLHGGNTELSIMNNGGQGAYFDMAGAATASNNYFAFRTSNSNSSYSVTERMRIASDGNVGIGTTTPGAGLVVSNGNFFVSSSTATSTLAGGLNVQNGAILHDWSSGLTSIDNLQLGNMNFEADAGILTWVDMPVTASATQGTIESYTARIDGNALFSIYSESNGSGGIQNSAVGVGTSTPIARFSVQGAAGSNALIDFASSTGTSLFRVTSAGNVGIGTTTPTAPLYVNGATVVNGWLYTLNGISSSVAGGTLNIGGNGETGAITFNTTNGNSKMYITNAGNVGIGTTSPTKSLYVYGDEKIKNAGSLYFGDLADADGVRLYTSGNNFLISQSNNANMTLSTAGSGNIILSPGGNVGIGAASPGAKLEVSGDIKLTSDLNKITIANGATIQDVLDVDNSYMRAIFGTNVDWDGSANVWNVRNNGGADYGAMYINNGSGIGFVNETGLTLPTTRTNAQFLAATKLFITNGGYIGINTTTPGRTLTVVGDMRATGILYDSSNSAGTSGMILQTSGTGYSWVATSTLGITGGGGVSGGTPGFVARFTSATAVSAGVILDNGTVAGVNATSSSYAFNIQGTGSVHPLQVGTSTNASMLVVRGDSGNVGIGVASPRSKLELLSTSAADGPFLTISNQPTAAGAFKTGIDFRASDLSTPNASYSSGRIYSVFDAGLYSAGRITLSTPTGEGTFTDVMTLKNGNVGIGTTAPTSLLFLQSAGQTVDLFRAASTTGSNMVKITPYGGFVQDISSSTAVSIKNGSGSPVFEIDTTQTSANSGIDITAGATQTGNMLNLYSSGGQLLGGFSAYGALFQNISSTTAVNIQNGAGAYVFNIDTVGKKVGIGTTTGMAALDIISDIAITETGNPSTGSGTATGLRVITSDADSPSVLIRNSSPVPCVGQAAGCTAAVAAGGAGFLTLESSTSSNTSYYNFITAFSGTNRGAANAVFRVRGDGNVYGEAAFNASGADYAEYFDTWDTSIEAGDLVIATTTDENLLVAAITDAGLSTSSTSTIISQLETSTSTPATSTINTLDKESKLVSAIQKSSKAYDQKILGIVSSQAAFIGNNPGGRNEINQFKKAVGLVGRVPVKATSENGEIKVGDFVTSSETKPGQAMKATRSGYVLGVALEDFKPFTSTSTPGYSTSTEGTVLVFIKPGYQMINNTFVLEDAGGQLTGQVGTSTMTNNALVIDQKGVGDILQLQDRGQNRVIFAQNGAMSILAGNASEHDILLSVQNASSTLFSINARGDAQVLGAFIMKDNTFAGSIATNEQGMATIDFTYHLGKGKPVVQLTAESETPVFAQVANFKQDGEGNYIGFIIKTFGLNGQSVSAVVHYNVTGKPDGYQTQGQTLNVTDEPQGGTVSVSPEPSGAGTTAADYQSATDIPVGTTVGPSYAPTEEVVVPADEAVSGTEPTQETLPTEEPAPAEETASVVESAPPSEPAPTPEPAPAE